MDNPSERKQVVGAQFNETTDLTEDFEAGRRIFECEADEVNDLKLWVHKGFDPGARGLTECLTVQWEAHDRFYRAEFRLGLVCDVRAAVLGHAGGVVQIAVPVLPECVPERLEIDV